MFENIKPSAVVFSRSEGVEPLRDLWMFGGQTVRQTDQDVVPHFELWWLLVWCMLLPLAL